MLDTPSPLLRSGVFSDNWRAGRLISEIIFGLFEYFLDNFAVASCKIVYQIDIVKSNGAKN